MHIQWVQLREHIWKNLVQRTVGGMSSICSMALNLHPSDPIRPSVENARELVSKDEGNRNPAAARIQRRHSQRLGYSYRVDVAGQCFLSISETVIHSMKLEKQITLYPWRILLLAMTF